MFVNLMTAFVKLLLFLNVPVEKVLEFYFLPDFNHGAGQAYRNKDVDSHSLSSASICVLFYFMRGLQVRLYWRLLRRLKSDLIGWIEVQ